MSDCIVGKKESTESDRLALEVKLDYSRLMETYYGAFLLDGFRRLNSKMFTRKGKWHMKHISVRNMVHALVYVV